MSWVDSSTTMPMGGNKNNSLLPRSVLCGIYDTKVISSKWLFHNIGHTHIPNTICTRGPAGVRGGFRDPRSLSIQVPPAHRTP